MQIAPERALVNVLTFRKVYSILFSIKFGFHAVVS